MVEQLRNKFTTEEILRSPQLIDAAKIAIREMGGLTGDQTLLQTTDGGFADIVKRLKKFHPAVQHCFLTIALEEAQFPNHRDLAQFLTWINHPSFRWLSPTQEPDSSLMQQLANDHLSALHLQPEPIKLIREDLHAAGAAWIITHLHATARATVWNTERDVAKHAAFASAGVVAWDAIAVALEAVENTLAEKTDAGIAEMVATRVARWDAFYAAARTAEWIVVQDLMPQRGYHNGNPYIPLMKMYAQGFWPIGQVGGEFIIFIPPLRKAA